MNDQLLFNSTVTDLEMRRRVHPLNSSARVFNLQDTLETVFSMLDVVDHANLAGVTSNTSQWSQTIRSNPGETFQLPWDKKIVPVSAQDSDDVKQRNQNIMRRGGAMARSIRNNRSGWFDKIVVHDTADDILQTIVDNGNRVAHLVINNRGGSEAFERKAWIAMQIKGVTRLETTNYEPVWRALLKLQGSIEHLDVTMPIGFDPFCIQLQSCKRLKTFSMVTDRSLTACYMQSLSFLPRLESIKLKMTSIEDAPVQVNDGFTNLKMISLCGYPTFGGMGDRLEIPEVLSTANNLERIEIRDFGDIDSRTIEWIGANRKLHTLFIKEARGIPPRLMHLLARNNSLRMLVLDQDYMCDMDLPYHSDGSGVEQNTAISDIRSLRSLSIKRSNEVEVPARHLSFGSQLRCLRLVVKSEEIDVEDTARWIWQPLSELSLLEELFLVQGGHLSGKAMMALRNLDRLQSVSFDETPAGGGRPAGWFALLAYLGTVKKLTFERMRLRQADLMDLMDIKSLTTLTLDANNPLGMGAREELAQNLPKLTKVYERVGAKKVLTKIGRTTFYR